MLTDEQRDALNEAICLARDDGLPGTEDHLRALLAAHSAGAQEPVAWMRSYRQFSDTQSAAPDPGHMVTSFHQNAEFAAKYPDENTPLYAHPQPMPQAQPVYDKSVVRRLATQWGMIPETAAARDALAEIITARKAMMKRIDDVHTADRQTGCNTFYDNDLERHTAILFRAIDAEIERLDRAKGE